MAFRRQYPAHITVQWEADTPGSRIRATYEASIEANKRAKTPILIVDLSVVGAKSSTMFEKFLPAPEYYGAYVFVVTENENIYEIDGIEVDPGNRTKR